MPASNLKNEEHAPLATLLRSYFVEDQADIQAQYSRFDADYLSNFDTQIQAAKNLGSVAVKTGTLKQSTVALYAYADAVDEELNTLAGYYEFLNLPKQLISKAKTQLKSKNIEGAVLTLNDVKHDVMAKKAQLEAEGMPANINQVLDNHRAQLSTLNQTQETHKDGQKIQTQSNTQTYDALYASISEICKAGKLVFKNNPLKTERYTISTLINCMRSNHPNSDTEDKK